MGSKYPPYPPYNVSAAPPSVAEAIVAGRSISVQHKSVVRPPAHPLPKPAKPKAPKVTDVKIARRAMKAHARCLRRHGAVLTDRLERLAKPRRRNVIYLWREHADLLPPETIERFRAMLNADEPFKPDQAYEYFVNCRKAKKKNAAHCSLLKKDTHTVVTDKRFLWARNATVAFARGIQQRLSRPGRYTLADGMLRLSNVILGETCGYMKISRTLKHLDKIAVWIDEILSESDDRMLMMDYDEDEADRLCGGVESTTCRGPRSRESTPACRGRRGRKPTLCTRRDYNPTTYRGRRDRKSSSSTCPRGCKSTTTASRQCGAKIRIVKVLKYSPAGLRHY
ncbi:uncharacterized protein LOC125225243 [Leguminivora glycinivorella]|uniref:uncharacterized protein LOC125225243 n=1 Tax=Leguminivora glycinivorella TaxID=1035111 RepID=UPI00200E03E3|nr:uncharacterized protein LOC125225243 [Leguminivora glycinivorella]